MCACEHQVLHSGRSNKLFQCQALHGFSTEIKKRKAVGIRRVAGDFDGK